MSVYYTSLVAAILLGTAGQIALKSADEGSPTVIAQFLNPLTILGLAVYRDCPLLYLGDQENPCVDRLLFGCGELRGGWRRWRVCCGTSPSGGRSWRASY
jgi:hypothetical protein